MEDMWRWLQTNQGPLVAIGTIALVAVTAFYAFLTARTAKAAERAANAAEASAATSERQVNLSHMPYLVPIEHKLVIDDVDGLLKMKFRIANEGRGPALNIRIAFAIYTGDTFAERTITPFTHLVGSLSPGHTFPSTAGQLKNASLTKRYSQDEAWRKAVGQGNFGLVLICSDPADHWFQFSNWKSRNRTEVEPIDKPVGEAGYED